MECLLQIGHQPNSIVQKFKPGMGDQKSYRELWN